MRKNKTILAILGCSLLALSSCANYKASSLNSLSTEVMHSQETSEAVLVSAKAFTKQDCKTYLDRDVIAKGYQPVQIYIQNNSSNNYIFSLSRVDINCAKYEAVAEKVHTSTLGRATAYGVGALFLWPLAIPAVVDGIKSSEANQSLDIDFEQKSARDQIIGQHSSFNKLLFVPINEFKSKFKITLIDQASNTPKVVDVIAY